MSDLPTNVSESFRKRNPHLYPAPEVGPLSAAAKLEIEEIHEPILKWCKDHRVPCIRARSDMQSTIAEGCQDFTVFYRGKVWCIEAKSRTGKFSPAQLGWRLLMEQQEFTVHTIRSYVEFLRLIGETGL